MLPEEEFVLGCARVLAGTATRDSVGRAPELDWRRVQSLASEHRISAGVEGHSLERVRWNLLLAGELLKVLDLFERSGIQAVPFKGPVLAYALYDDPALRESCDLDILLRPRDIQRARELLAAAGYSTDLPSGHREQAAYLRSRYELHFTAPVHGISIEIHQFFLAGSYCVNLDYEALWRRAAPIPFFGREVLNLSPNDLLVMLSIHGAKHSWRELIHLCDLTRLLVTRGSAIRWAEVLDETRAAGVRRILRVGLLLASKLLCAPVPHEILKEAASDSRALELCGQASQSLFAAPTTAGSFGEYLQFLRTRERFRDRLVSAASLMWSPNEEDYSRLKLPGFLSSLYVPFHVIRVAGKYGRAMVKANCLPALLDSRGSE